jgi:hypothetical protein
MAVTPQEVKAILDVRTGAGNIQISGIVLLQNGRPSCNRAAVDFPELVVVLLSKLPASRAWSVKATLCGVLTNPTALARRL